MLNLFCYVDVCNFNFGKYWDLQNLYSFIRLSSLQINNEQSWFSLLVDSGNTFVRLRLEKKHIRSPSPEQTH